MARRKCNNPSNAVMDLQKLSEEEIARIVQVIEKDFAIRAMEEKRLKKRKKEMEVAKRKLRELATRRSDIDDKLCVICLDRFILFFNPKEQCFGCRYYICKKCCTFVLKYNSYICRICLQRSDLIGMTCEWFYEAVKRRFKEFGSVKIAKCLLKDSSQDDQPGGLVKVSAFGSQSSLKVQSGLSKDLMSPEVLDRVKQAQTKKFRETIDDLTSKATEELKQSSHECEKEFAITNLQSDIRSALKNFSQVLYVTLETNNSMLSEDQKISNIHQEVQTLIQREVEQYVGHEIDVNFEDTASLESEVESCANGERSDFEDTLSKQICNKVMSHYVCDNQKENFERDTRKRASVILDDLDNSLLSYEDINQLELNMRRRKTSTPNIGLPPHIDALDFLEFSRRDKEVDPDSVSLSGVSDQFSDIDDTSESMDYRHTMSHPSLYSNTDAEYKSAMEGSWIQLAKNPQGSLNSLHSSIDRYSITPNEQSTLRSIPTKSIMNGHSASGNPYGTNVPPFYSREPMKTRLSQDSGFMPENGEHSLNSSLNLEHLQPLMRNGSFNSSFSKLGHMPLVTNVLDGEAASFKIRISNPNKSKVEWFRLISEKKVPLSPTDKYEFVTSRDPGSVHHVELIIWDACSADEGEYKASVIAETDANVESESFFNLKVKENNKIFRRPEFVRSITDQDVELGQDMTFKCRVIGYPEPRLIFFRDGKPLSPIKNKIEFSSRSEPIFQCKIFNVTEDDEAEYSCLVSNRIGRCHCEAQLTINESSDIEIQQSEYKSPSQNKMGSKSMFLSKPNPDDQVTCVADYRQSLPKFKENGVNQSKENNSKPSSINLQSTRFNGKEAPVRSSSARRSNHMERGETRSGPAPNSKDGLDYNYSFQDIRSKFDSIERGAPVIRNSSITGRSYQVEKAKSNSLNRSKNS